MPFITFIYRIGNRKTSYYGKYVCDYISDDHEGLDVEIRSTVIGGINEYRNQTGATKPITEIHIGILSFSSNNHIPTFSSDAEIQCFDFYHKYVGDKRKTYINGRIVNGRTINRRII